MKKLTIATLLFGLTGCGSSTFGTPVVTTLHTGADVETDVAWVIENDRRVLRCVNGPERPICVRAEVR